MNNSYLMGLDFGTLSGRAVIVRASDGAEMGTAVHEYPHGVMDRADGRKLPPDFALQDPADYLGTLEVIVHKAVEDAGVDPGRVVGIVHGNRSPSPFRIGGEPGLSGSRKRLSGRSWSGMESDHPRQRWRNGSGGRRSAGTTGVPAAAGIGTPAAAENKDWRRSAPGVVWACVAIDDLP